MDGLISLAVILATLGVVSLVFITTERRRRARRQKLTAHCEAHGWSYHEEKERLRRASVIEGPGWRLETGVKASERSVESGSPDLIGYTFWESEEMAAPLPVMRFGTVPGASPGRIAAAMPLLAQWVLTGDESGLEPVPLKPPLDDRFLLLALPGAECNLGEPVEQLLASLPRGWDIQGKVGPDRMRLTVPGLRMDNPQDLDTVIQLGMELLERFLLHPEGDLPRNSKEET